MTENITATTAIRIVTCEGIGVLLSGRRLMTNTGRTALVFSLPLAEWKAPQGQRPLSIRMPAVHSAPHGFVFHTVFLFGSMKKAAPEYF